ncbi:asparagine synthase-related protein [Kitasatospora sp. NPDC056184]|uniref:asparagine synthase-related protein n=1 Tax=Kitasatospora sp. NPDC056184 TaxID=3345738 RepID=UPI0035D71FD8
MRHVTGTLTHALQPAPGPRPRGARVLHDDGLLRAWTVGHPPEEVLRALSGDGTSEVILVGACLPTAREAQDAVDAASRGHWHAAGRLSGSCLAIVRTGRTLRLVGTRAASVEVHWTSTTDTLAWSTSAAALAALTGAAPNLQRLLASITTWGVEPGADGWFDGVHRVPPGSALTLAPAARPAVERPPAPVGRPFADAAEALRHELPLAIGLRAPAGRPWSTDLSGGVDSGAVTCLAAAHADLTAVTYVDAAMADQDDTRYAAEIAAAYPGITRHLVDGRRTGSRHFDALTDRPGLPVTDAPSLGVGMLGILAAQLAPAVAAGSAGHLTGWGGDNVLDAFASPADRYRSGSRAAALRDAHRLARERRSAAHPVLRAVAATGRGTYPKALADLAETVLAAAGAARGGRRGPLVRHDGRRPLAHPVRPGCGGRPHRRPRTPCQPRRRPGRPARTPRSTPTSATRPPTPPRPTAWPSGSACATTPSRPGPSATTPTTTPPSSTRCAVSATAGTSLNAPAWPPTRPGRPPTPPTAS